MFRFRSPAVRLLRGTAPYLTLLLATSCQSPDATSVGMQSSTLASNATPGSALFAHIAETPLPDGTTATSRWGRPVPAPERPLPPRSNGQAFISDRLRERISDAGPGEPVTVCIGVARGHRALRLPPLAGTHRDTIEGQMLLAERRALLREMEAESERSRAPVKKLLTQLGGLVTDESFMANTLCASVSSEVIDEIARAPGVLYLSADISGAPAAPPPEPIQDAAVRIGTAYWNETRAYDGRRPGLYVGLIDTGVNFANPSLDADPSAFYLDCTSGTDDLCTGEDPSDHYAPPYAPDKNGHGTGVYAVMRNATTGANAGMTDAVIDTFGVHGSDYTNNVLRALRRSLGVGDDIIVANIQPNQSVETFPIVAAANWAYEMGVAVIAAAGNVDGCEGTTCYVAYPAAGEHVLAVGNHDRQAGGTAISQRTMARGYPEKPDVQATTPIAKLPFDWKYFYDEPMSDYGRGTSYATPQVASAATILWDYLASTGLAVEPGHVYAALIESGREESPSSDTGAGPIALAGSNSGRVVGSVDVTTTGAITIDIPLHVDCPRDLRIAWWWENDADTSYADSKESRSGSHFIAGELSGANTADDVAPGETTWGKMFVPMPNRGQNKLSLTHYEWQSVDYGWLGKFGRYAPATSTKRVYYSATYRQSAWCGWSLQQ